MALPRDKSGVFADKKIKIRILIGQHGEIHISLCSVARGIALLHRTRRNTVAIGTTFYQVMPRRHTLHQKLYIAVLLNIHRRQMHPDADYVARPAPCAQTSTAAIKRRIGIDLF